MDKKVSARQDWEAGMKYREIAEKHGVSEGTIKSWAARYWKAEKVATSVATKNKKVATKKVQPAQPPATPTVDQQLAAAVEENDELTPRQRDFCLYYSRTKNATQAYLKAYDCAYAAALSAGPRLLGNVRIKEELQRLREIKAAHLREVCGDDFVDLRARIALADITDFVKFGDGVVAVKDSDGVDGQLISEISEGPNGIKIKLASREKALEFMEGYLGLNSAGREGDESGDDNNLLEVIKASAAALGDSDAI